MNLKLKYFFLVLVLFFINKSLYSQSATARWLLLKPSAHSMALGGTGAGYNLNIFSAYFNPAALAFGKDITFSASYVNPYPFFPNVTSSFIGLSFNIHDQHIISLNGNLFKHSLQAARDETGSMIGQMTVW